jgi:hypothetical protein
MEKPIKMGINFHYKGDYESEIAAIPKELVINPYSALLNSYQLETFHYYISKTTGEITGKWVVTVSEGQKYFPFWLQTYPAGL